MQDGALEYRKVWYVDLAPAKYSLLCVRCYNGIGLVRVQPRLLRRAATYVTVEPRLRSARAELDDLARERARALVKAGI